MVSEIKRKELWKGLNNITQLDWLRAARRLPNVSVVESNSGTSHYINLRDPRNPNLDDVRGVISTLVPNCYKQSNEKVFKRLLDYGKKNGFTEDDIWKALGSLK